MSFVAIERWASGANTVNDRVIMSPGVVLIVAAGADTRDLVVTFSAFPTEPNLRLAVGDNGYTRFEYSGPEATAFGITYKSGSYINANAGHSATDAFVAPILFNPATQRRNAAGNWELLGDDGLWHEVGVSDVKLMQDPVTGKLSLKGTVSDGTKIQAELRD